jgi:hypothetical protein
MPLNIEVTQFPNGIGTARDNSVLNSIPLPGPNVGALSVEDFGQDTGIADWTDLAIGAGVAGDVFPLGANGVLQQVSAGAATDGNKLSIQRAGVDTFSLLVGQEVWFGLRFRISDALNTILVFGFTPFDETVAPVDGVFLRSDDVSAALNLVSIAAAGGTSTVVLGTLADDTWYDAAMYWDGVDKVSAQFVGPDGVIGGGGNILPGANLTAVGLNPGFLFSDGVDGAAKTLDVDWVLFGGSR